MNKKIIWTLMLFAMFVVGLQTVQPATAFSKVDQFAIYHPDGQSSDADVIKVYKYNSNHMYITYTGYNWKPSLHKYVKCGFFTWTDVAKITKTKLRIKEPKMEGRYSYTYRWTKHTASYYYWHTMRYQLKHRQPLYRV